MNSDRVRLIPDTPVFDRLHRPHDAGRHALRVVLEARVSPALFADAQLEQLIVASGGNLRDLFSLVNQAAENALLRPDASGRIEAVDSEYAINQLRADYERRLGQSPYDGDDVKYEDKAARLVQIYDQKPDAKIPSPVLYSLLRSRAVQEFNHDRWFGVHPLVVDILAGQGKLGTDVVESTADAQTPPTGSMGPDIAAGGEGEASVTAAPIDAAERRPVKVPGGTF